jgi:uncharacterized lipoprotein YddW (UPF0748 family)
MSSSNAFSRRGFAAALAGAGAVSGLAHAQAQGEFRGVWVASVAHIDWPGAAGLAGAAQRAQALAILDAVARVNGNAIVLQVRPMADALYASALEPWSAMLSGRQGEAPDPPYDPLAFWIAESHRRGLELHAWFNPFRARHPSNTSAAAPNHVEVRRPDLVRRYGKHLWLDPGEPEAAKHSLGVIADVLARYDIDGIHYDDYFYPYPEAEAPFPDEASFARYRDGGGGLARDDWRRDNIDRFVEAVYGLVKRHRPKVKVGISPFGIWRPGHPDGVTGFDAYARLYADARRWLREGWCDYMAPQLYWRLDNPNQPFAKLLDWWIGQNAKGRHLYPGLFTGKVAEAPAPWPAEEFVRQIEAVRSRAGAQGCIHFSARVLRDNSGGIADALTTRSYAAPAAVPAMRWL